MSTEEAHVAASFPEHKRMKAVSEKSQAIGGFLDWLQNERGLVIAYWNDWDELVPTSASIQRLLAEYFEIDLDKVEAEKQEMLEILRSHQK